MNREGKIKDVYKENFHEEMLKISEIVERYNYISMDTEFPGVLYTSLSQPAFQNDKRNLDLNVVENQDSCYLLVKRNVEDLKLIQVGITLANKDGILPEGISTWQFNLYFDVNFDYSSPESINLLESSGIDFKVLKSRGIDHSVFAESMISSGLVLNDSVSWVAFHGIYDFAYLLHLLSNSPLPDNESSFMKSLEMYFPNIYDTRYLIINNMSWLRGSLSKITNDLDIKRVGVTHQAGSDSLITSKLFFKLVHQFDDQIDIEGDKNKVFGFNYNSILDDDIYDANRNFSQNMNYDQGKSQFEMKNYYVNNQPQINVVPNQGQNFLNNSNFNNVKSSISNLNLNSESFNVNNNKYQQFLRNSNSPLHNINQQSNKFIPMQQNQMYYNNPSLNQNYLNPNYNVYNVRPVNMMGGMGSGFNNIKNFPPQQDNYMNHQIYNGVMNNKNLGKNDINQYKNNNIG